MLELFSDAAHRLSLRVAIERGELVSIRCVRVKTNVDLSLVRFNEVQYNRQDLETTITVPARSVSGVMTFREREAVLAAFARGELHMLCACDLLNEGWDCPDVEAC